MLRGFSSAWLVVALLWPVALLNYLDRQLLATMRRSIMSDLPDIGTEENFGKIMAIFLYVYAVLSPVGGLVADRCGRRAAIVTSLGVWSVVTWLTGHAANFQQLWWARAAMGVSEACYMPAALALIADFHTGPTRSRAIGLHQSGIYAGLALGGVGGWIADVHGWRNGFCWFGAGGVLYAMLLWQILPQPPVAETARSSPRLGAPGALFTGSFLLLVIYFTLPALSGWVMKNWLPSVLADSFHLAQTAAGFSATLWITLASLAGALLGGGAADRWMQRTQNGRIYTSACGAALLALALLGVAWATVLPAAIAFLVLFGLGWGFYDANNMPILCQITRPEQRATAYGLMNLVSTAAGAWVTVRVGALRDQGAPLPLIFGAGAILAAVSALLVLFIRPRAVDAAECGV